MEKNNKESNSGLTFITCILIICGSLSIGYSQEVIHVTKAKLISIDTSSFRNYFFLKFKDRREIYKVLVIKDSLKEKGTIEYAHHYFLILDKMDFYTESGLNVTYYGHDFLIDGNLILKAGEFFYSSRNLKGLTYINLRE